MFKDDVQRILMRDTGTGKVKEDKNEKDVDVENKDNKEHEMSSKNFIHG